MREGEKNIKSDKCNRKQGRVRQLFPYLCHVVLIGVVCGVWPGCFSRKCLRTVPRLCITLPHVLHAIEDNRLRSSVKIFCSRPAWLESQRYCFWQVSRLMPWIALMKRNTLWINLSKYKIIEPIALTNQLRKIIDAVHSMKSRYIFVVNFA